MPVVELKRSGVNLWEDFPDLDAISEFRKLRKKEGDERSNNILKAIYYIWDPKSDKKDSGYSEEELIPQITENIIGDKKFPWPKYEEVKAAWFKYCMTDTDHLLVKYQKEADEFLVMLDDWVWTKDNVLERAAALKAYKVLLEDIAEIKRKFYTEKLERQDMEGNYTLSLLEERA